MVHGTWLESFEPELLEVTVGPEDPSAGAGSDDGADGAAGAESRAN